MTDSQERVGCIGPFTVVECAGRHYVITKDGIWCDFGYPPLTRWERFKIALKRWWNA